MGVPEDKATSRAEFDKKDAISKILDSLVTLVDQHLREHRIREGTWFWSTSFQTTKKHKTMFNNWESALADNTSKDLFGTKFEEETCKS